MTRRTPAARVARQAWLLRLDTRYFYILGPFRPLIAVLLGAEFNAELERGRQIEAGHPADEEPFLEPRDTRKMNDKED